VHNIDIAVGIYLRFIIIGTICRVINYLNYYHYYYYLFITDLFIFIFIIYILVHMNQ